jgi:hypothetical protein
MWRERRVPEGITITTYSLRITMSNTRCKHRWRGYPRSSIIAELCDYPQTANIPDLLGTNRICAEETSPHFSPASRKASIKLSTKAGSISIK